MGRKRNRQKISGVWTLMVLPHNQNSTHRLRVTRWHVRFLTAFLLLLIIASVGFGVSTWLLWDNKAILEGDIQEQRGRLSNLANNNENLQSLVSQHAQDFQSLSDQLAQIEEQENQVRALTKVVAPRAEAELDGTGGPSESNIRSLDEIIATADASGEAFAEDLDVEEIYSTAERTSRKLALLIDDLKKEKYRQDHFPTIWPVRHPDRRITSSYAWRNDPINGRRRHHDGLDIGAPWGAEIVATADGRVAKAGWDDAYGNMVVIDHGFGIRTVYGHSKKLFVKRGEEVKKGQKIALVGSTGRAKGKHLHYEIWLNDDHVDPKPYLSFPTS